MIFKRHFIYLLVLAVLLVSCSNTKHLPAGETLFMGGKVNILDKENTSKKQRNVLTTDLTGLVRPRPNSRFLGVPFKLSIYNFGGKPHKKKGLRVWLHNKVGEPPVLTSTVRVTVNKELVINLLHNRGFFYPTVNATLKTTKKKKTTLIFNVTTGPQYKINEIKFMGDSSQISIDIDSTFKETLLKPGAPYDLDLIKAERNRIDGSLKKVGYYYFKSDYILVLVDSGIGNHKVNMYVKLKRKEIPDVAYNIYNTNNVYIFCNYRLRGNGEDTVKANAVVYKGYNIVDIKKAFKPEVFYRAMRLSKGKEYNIDDQNTALSRLVNLGTFKFVKNRFEPVSDTSLNVYYYLTQYPKKSLQFQVGALTQNDDRAGCNGSITWKNRNTFKGAEQLSFKIDGGFEAQYSGLVKEPNIYNVGAETELSFPRFEVPFFKIYTSGAFMPRSIIKLTYDYESESDLLRINSYKVSYGFDWKQNAHIEHQFYPFNFIYVRTDTLGNADQLAELYGDLIFNGIILGPTYEFTYNSQVGPPRKNSYYFDGLIDLSGMLLGLAEHADYNTNPQTLFGSTYAQYVKLQPDFRYYYRFSPQTILAARIMAGIGIPYGNSNQLPNIKEFWAGGNSDLRGFPSRLVGPGTFSEYTQATNTTAYIETLGDIKAESNIELRQHIYKFINAAIFADAGNIWLYHDNIAFPGGKFTTDFYQQLNVDMGIGLRFDFKILILRLDLGMPVREAWLPDDERWVFNKIDFGSSLWRKDNLVFNIGIGYPF